MLCILVLSVSVFRCCALMPSYNEYSKMVVLLMILLHVLGDTYLLIPGIFKVFSPRYEKFKVLILVLLVLEDFMRFVS